MSGGVDYWEGRYLAGRGSGRGSRGRQANRKAGYVNKVVRAYKIRSIADWGCGDGIVACKIKVARYIGLEVSQTALEICKKRADGPGREWYLFDGLDAPEIRADLALSLDVIFHLTDDRLYRRHLELLFGSAAIVLIAAANKNQSGRIHVQHRRFLSDVPGGWRIPNKPADQDEIGMWLFRKAAR